MKIKGTVAALLMTICLAKSGTVVQTSIIQQSMEKFKTQQIEHSYVLNSDEGKEEEND